MHTITQAGLPKQSPGSRANNVSPAVRRTRALPATLSPDASDDAVIQEIANGDRRSMEVLYARHHVRVYRFSLGITGNTASAEDIVSEVFFDVWRQAGAQIEFAGFHLAIGHRSQQGVIGSQASCGSAAGR